MNTLFGQTNSGRSSPTDGSATNKAQRISQEVQAHCQAQVTERRASTDLGATFSVQSSRRASFASVCSGGSFESDPDARSRASTMGEVDDMLMSEADLAEAAATTMRLASTETDLKEAAKQLEGRSGEVAKLVKKLREMEIALEWSNRLNTELTPTRCPLGALPDVGDLSPQSAVQESAAKVHELQAMVDRTLASESLQGAELAKCKASLALAEEKLDKLRGELRLAEKAQKVSHSEVEQIERKLQIAQNKLERALQDKAQLEQRLEALQLVKKELWDQNQAAGSRLLLPSMCSRLLLPELCAAAAFTAPAACCLPLSALLSECA